ncbi:lytic transglycosylase domain-containing protein [Ochrobactrum pecoris]|nr:lytic transglycosylase domain-containing protein [Brucella pecoris]TNV08678.1 lytic transglycosylase domain-containing protein [Brucella pecoris]
MGNGDGGPCAAVAVLMALLIAATMTVTLPYVAIADPLSSARTETAAGPSNPWADHITEAAKRFAIPEQWIRAVMTVESAGDVRALSSAGAIGLMQIMPATWEELRIRHGLGSDPYDPRDNILAGAAYLAELHDLYGSPGFLAAYNAGHGRYEKHLVTGDLLPAETRAYVAKIAPQIDANAAATLQITDRPARTDWYYAPLFVGLARVPSGDNSTADDHRSVQPYSDSTITDLSALAPPSDGLFIPRSRTGVAK